MKKLIEYILLLGVFHLLISPGFAQQAGALDEFLNTAGPDQTVHAVRILNTGKVLITGNFNAYNQSGSRQGHVTLLNQNGGLAPEFISGVGANNAINTAEVLTEGNILIAGDFLEFNLQNINRIARLLPNGTLDTSFNPGGGANNSIFALRVLPDGKILIGGSFTSYNGVGRNRIARLNADGSLDTSFDPGAGANQTVRTIELQPDGKIILGGDFTQYNNIDRGKVARLHANGSLDTSFTVGGGANNSVYAVKIQSDNKILVGGDFSSFDGGNSSRIVRLNADGSQDATFMQGSGTNGIIRALEIQADGKIIVGGEYTFYNGSARKNILRLNIDGTLDDAFIPETNTNNSVWTIQIDSDGSILIGGSFVSVNGISRVRIARLNADGSLYLPFNSGSGANQTLRALQAQTDGKIILGGEFTVFNDVNINRIVRVNPNGSLDETFNPGGGAAGAVFGIAVQEDGKILVVGGFTVFNGQNYNRIVRLNPDGSIDPTFQIGSGADNNIWSVDVQVDHKILISGDFINFNGTPRSRLARLNPDGSVDTSFNPGNGADNSIRTIVAQSDTTILIGGAFFQYNGIFRYRIARLLPNGSLDLSFAPEGGFSNTVLRIKTQIDDKIVVAGTYNSFNGVARNRIARLNTDGSLDRAFNPGDGANGTIDGLSVLPDGKILLGGEFTMYNNSSRNYLVRLNSDGSLDPTFNIGSGLNAQVRDILTQDNGRTILIGNFTAYNGVGRARVARIFSAVPRIPQNFQSSEIGDNSFRLSWDKIAGISQYEIDVSEDNFVSTLPGYLNRLVKDTTILINQLKPGTLYSCRVRAINEQGSSPSSRPIQVVIKPEKPADLQAKPISLSQIEISWDFDPLAGNTYRIQFSPESDSVFTDLTLLNGNSYTHSGLQPQTTYYYRIQAFKNGVFSDFSSIVGATTFADIVTADETDLFGNLLLYPNPSENLLTLEWNKPLEKSQKLILADQSGKIIYDQELSIGATDLTIDVSTLPRGIYFLTLEGKHRTLTRKIIH